MVFRSRSTSSERICRKRMDGGARRSAAGFGTSTMGTYTSARGSASAAARSAEVSTSRSRAQCTYRPRRSGRSVADLVRAASGSKHASCARR